MNPKLILSDIDGTFIYDDTTISKKTINTLNNLINHDPSYHFGLITGRACYHALYLYDQLGLHNTGFLIGNNGTQILNALTKEVIEEHTLDPVVTAKIYEKLMEITKRNSKMQIFVNYNQQPLVYIYNIPETF
ncbi:HAD family phosphatase [bacterium]|nr:HAD family phosphatase [bacterium]